MLVELQELREIDIEEAYQVGDTRVLLSFLLLHRLGNVSFYDLEGDGSGKELYLPIKLVAAEVGGLPSLPLTFFADMMGCFYKNG